MRPFVEIQSPFGAEDDYVKKRNEQYAKACVRDSILRGEIPFSECLFYGIDILNYCDRIEEGLIASIGSELCRGLPNVITAVYTDLGLFPNMEFAIERAKFHRRDITYRSLGVKLSEPEVLEESNLYMPLWELD